MHNRMVKGMFSAWRCAVGQWHARVVWCHRDGQSQQARQAGGRAGRYADAGAQALSILMTGCSMSNEIAPDCPISGPCLPIPPMQGARELIQQLQNRGIAVYLIRWGGPAGPGWVPISLHPASITCPELDHHPNPLPACSTLPQRRVP